MSRFSKLIFNLKFWVINLFCSEKIEKPLLPPTPKFIPVSNYLKAMTMIGEERQKQVGDSADYIRKEDALIDQSLAIIASDLTSLRYSKYVTDQERLNQLAQSGAYIVAEMERIMRCHRPSILMDELFRFNPLTEELLNPSSAASLLSDVEWQHRNRGKIPRRICGSDPFSHTNDTPKTKSGIDEWIKDNFKKIDGLKKMTNGTFQQAPMEEIMNSIDSMKLDSIYPPSFAKKIDDNQPPVNKSEEEKLDDKLNGY